MKNRNLLILEHNELQVSVISTIYLNFQCYHILIFPSAVKQKQRKRTKP